MSGQWEVVGKKKDRGSKLAVPKANEKSKKENKQKNILNGVKIEEVLPKSQVQSLYTSGKNKENNKPQEKPSRNEAKKVEKKLQKPQEPQKPKPPKSIEMGLNSIDVDEFTSLYEKTKNTYPDAPIVWLKEMVQFLNQKIPVDVPDPVFSSKPSGYPLSAVPSSLKTLIERSVKEAGKNNSHLFFDIALTSMVTDISKGLPGLGYKFYLQYIALNEPKLVSANISKHVTLRNSYQNRANVALSILWAVGQVGVNDFNSGFTVFQELMLPLIEMKNFSRYVGTYLLNLLSRQDGATLNKDQYLLILDTIYSTKKNFPVDLQKQLSSSALGLQQRLLKDDREKYQGHVDVFLKKISTNSNKTYQNCLCDTIVTIFSKDRTTVHSWNKLYQKNVASSAVLLKYIRDNLKTVLISINKASLLSLLKSLQTINEELSTRKRKEDGLKESIQLIKEINEKLLSEKKRGSFFGRLFKFLFVLLSVGIIAETLYKTNQGKLEHSSLVKISKTAGCGLKWVDSRFAENFPEHHKKVVEISEPYVILVRDLGKIALNSLVHVKEVSDIFIKEKWPIVKQSIDKYAPGLLEQSQKTFSTVYSTSVLYYDRSVNYLKKEVFVGQLSPEHVERVMWEAFNTTSKKAAEYYHWLYEKVQTTIK